MEELITIEELGVLLGQFNPTQGYDLEVIFMLNSNDGISYSKVRFDDDVENILKGDIIDSLLEEIQNNIHIFQYDPATTPDRDTIYFLSENDFIGNPNNRGNTNNRNERIQLPFLRQDNIEIIDGDLDEIDINMIRAYFFKITRNNDHNDTEIWFFKKKHRSQILRRGWSFCSTGGRLTLFNRNLFTFDDMIDGFFMYNGNDHGRNGFYILQKNNFESIFNYTQQLEHRAQESILSLCDRLHILDENINIEVNENMDIEGNENINRDERIRRYYGAFLDKHTTAKINQLDLDFWSEKGREIEEEGGSLHEHLLQYCDEFHLQIDGDPDRQCFRPADKTQFKTLVKLLADDYLISELTDRKYNSHSKERIIQNQGPN